MVFQFITWKTKLNPVSINSPSDWIHDLMLKKLGNLLNNSKQIDRSIRLYNTGKVMNKLENERTFLLNTFTY